MSAAAVDTANRRVPNLERGVSILSGWTFYADGSQSTLPAVPAPGGATGPSFDDPSTAPQVVGQSFS